MHDPGRATALAQRLLGLEAPALAELLARPLEELSPADVEAAAAAQDALGGLAAPALALRRPRLFIDTQHGFGNRMRAIASAAAIAQASGRELVVVWQPGAARGAAGPDGI